MSRKGGHAGDASRKTLDSKGRQKLFEDIHARMLADAPLLALFNMALIGAVRKNVDA